MLESVFKTFTYAYVHRLQFIYIDRVTGSVYANTNKQANDFNPKSSQIVRATSKNAIKKVFFEWLHGICGNFVVDNELMNSIRDIVDNSKKTRFQNIVEMASFDHEEYL